MLAAAAFNFMKSMRELQYFLLFLRKARQRTFIIQNSFCRLVNQKMSLSGSTIYLFMVVPKISYYSYLYPF